jgi:hypothetical protein
MNILKPSPLVPFLGVCFVAMFPQAGFACVDAHIGTWKVNLSKSIYSPGPPPKNPAMTAVERAGQGIRVISKVNAEGKPTETVLFTANCDGKDYPLPVSQVADTVALRRVDDYTIERIDRKAGKVVVTHVFAFSKDGKTRTQTVKGTNAKGEPISAVVVWEKQ